MQPALLTRSITRLLTRQNAAVGAAAATSCIFSGTAAYSQKIPGPTPVQGTGGGDRPSTNDDTRDLSRYGDPMAKPAGPAAIELETEEIRRAEAGEPIFTPHTAEQDEVPEWKKASMGSDSSSRDHNDPRADLPSDSNRRWMSADDLGTRVTEATEGSVTPRWPKPGPADQLGTPARAGAPMDASTSVDKPHASATTSQFGGDPTREQEVPYQEHRQGKAIPNEAAANQ